MEWNPKMRQYLDRARKANLVQDLPAVAAQFRLAEGVDVDSDDALITPVAYVEYVVHPVFAALMLEAGATPRGQMSFTVGLGEDSPEPTPLRVLTQHLDTGLLYPDHMLHDGDGRPRSFQTASGNTTYNGFANVYRQLSAAAPYRPEYEHCTRPFPADEKRFGVVGVSEANSVMWIKVYNNPEAKPAGHLEEIHKAVGRRLPGRQYLDARPLLAAEAIEYIEWLASCGVSIVDPDDNAPLAKIRSRLATSVVAVPRRGQPARAEVTVGVKVRALLPGLPSDEPAAGASFSRTEATANALMETLGNMPVVSSVVHPGVADIGRMELAEPYEHDGLWDHQKVAVARHLATDIGYLNASSPGMGKTIMALFPMQLRSRNIDRYRGLVVVEANVRDQWSKEALKWFPDAKVVTVTGSDDAADLKDALENTDGPLVVVCSYYFTGQVTVEKEEAEARAETKKAKPVLTDTQLGLFGDDVVIAQSVIDDAAEDTDEDSAPESVGALLLGTYFHDIIADEAEVLRGTGSKQNRGLWTLRKNAGVAVALTGTPINRGLDDLGKLISWVRNDERLFYGVKLSDTFDLNNDAELTRFAESMGAVLFRRDTSEVSDDLPTVKTQLMKLSPSAAEKTLADAARLELKRVYDELVAALDSAEETDPDNPAYAEARAALTEARGAWLGGTQLARMAASDPAALLSSNSAGAALLTGQGLVGAATQETGTKRAAVVADVTERVANGDAILVFTEFATVARGLIDDLEAAGVRVGSVLGGGGKQRDRMVTQFQDGELDVLVCTSSGERGLNLQRANVIYHYDLPWTPKGVIQRTGRARRLKSENNELTVVFPLMAETIEERVATLVVSRAVESMRALDSSRGVDASASEMGLALGGLAAAAVDTRAGRSQSEQLMAITAELVG